MAFDPSRETVAAETPFQTRLHWGRGAAAGFVAAAVTAGVIAGGDPAFLREVVAALYLQRGSLVAGTLAHLLHGTLFGVGFALLLSDPSLYRVEEGVARAVPAGVAFGAVLALAGGGIALPLWLAAVGGSAPLPYVTVPLVAWHLLYGAILGGTYAALRRGTASG